MRARGGAPISRREGSRSHALLRPPPPPRPARPRRAAGALLLAGAACLLAAAAAALLPRAGAAWQLREAADDPGALAALRLREAATPERLGREIDAALAAGDPDLARSLVAVAEHEGAAVAPARRAAVAALEESAAARAVAEAARGFATGQGEGVPGLAGALAGDLVGYGDLRDLWSEGGKFLRREAYDPMLLGLSAVGLTLTGATVASFGLAAGAGVPAHAGTTTLKLATRTGRLSKPLQGILARATEGLVDAGALRGSFAALARLDLAGARATLGGALRPAALRRLRGLGEEAAALQRRVGTRGILQALSLAESADDLRRAGRLSERLGTRARGALALLGRGALVLGAAALTLLQALWLAAAWFLAAALFCRRLGTVIGRLLFRRPSARRRPEGPGDQPEGARGARALVARVQHHLRGRQRRQPDLGPDLGRA
ncbi:hypothetical protein QA634_20120 [Methylobacterium sp. CB376]|uniref:hypothetical protein n=1 Tax=Methylobacterium sp. CB376 TaxID=3138063 RepID=UPI0024B24EFD|nr:hypothetical protein [Methylobacterium nodulans]WFT77624.1 hypothetical protein QA634_20120 [Methylobacterium nodulans]